VKEIEVKPGVGHGGQFVPPPVAVGGLGCLIVTSGMMWGRCAAACASAAGSLVRKPKRKP